MSHSIYSRRAASALILSDDALGAALLGAAIELVGFRAMFARDGEPAGEAVRRVKPRLVLLDAQDAQLREPGVLGPAMMTGAALAFFGRADALRDLTILASQTHALRVALPEDVARLGALLARHAGTERPSER